jgi:hypothetical protein
MAERLGPSFLDLVAIAFTESWRVNDPPNEDSG